MSPSPASPKPASTGTRPLLALRGTGEVAEGENLEIALGDAVVLGRSRHCDWSLKRTPTWLKSQDAERQRLRATLSWRSTSRRHCRLTYLAPDLLDVENLSQNGTFVDGSPVARVLLSDCRTTAHRIQLGPHGVVLEVRPSHPADGDR